MTVINSGKKLKCILVAILIFLYVFNPLLFSIELRQLVEIACIINIIFSLFIRKWKLNLNKEKLFFFEYFVPFFIYFIVMTIIHSVLSTHTGTSVYTDELLLILRIYIRIYLVLLSYEFFCINNSISIENQKEIIVWVATAQVFFVLLCFFVPSFRGFIIQKTMQHTTNEYMIRLLTYNNGRRGYGLTENWYDAFGYILSLLLAIIFLSWLKNQGGIKKILLTILLFLSVVLNSRTGIILSIIAILLSTVLYKKSAKLTLKILGICISIPIIFLIIIRILPSNTVSWIQDGISEINELINGGEATGTFALLQNGVIWPQDAIWGMGASPEALSAGSTDIGYIQCVWRYGIVGTVLLIGAFLLICVHVFRISQKVEYRVLLVIIPIIFLIYLLKIYCLNNIGADFIIFWSILTIANDNCNEYCNTI